METIAPVIRDLRKQLGLTQEDFASELGITLSTINRWEQGHARPSKLARVSLVRVAGRHGVDVTRMVAAIDRRAQPVHGLVCGPALSGVPSDRMRRQGELSR